MTGGWGAFGFNTFTAYGRNVEQIEAIKGPAGEGLAPGQVKGLAAATSAAEGALYTVGLGRFGGRLVSPLMNRMPATILDRFVSSTVLPARLGRLALRFGAAEVEGAATMASAAATERLAEEFAKTKTDPDHEFDPGPAADNWIETFEAGLRDFALLSAFGAGGRFLRETGISRLVDREAAVMAHSAEVLRDSKLAARDPEAVEQLVAGMAPGQTVLVDRQAWDQYWTEKRIDPRGKAAEIAGDEGKAYDAATGTQYLALPFEKYQVRLAKTEHYAALAPDVKFSPESRTAREDQTFQADQARRDEEARKARADELDRDRAEVARLVRERVIAAGIGETEAAAAAELVARSGGNVAVRTGMSVHEGAALAGLSSLRRLGPEGAALVEPVRAALLARAEATRLLAERWAGMGPKEKLRAFYVDRNTGVLNARGFERLPPDPERPLVAQVSVEGTKWANDTGSHEIGNRLYRMAARALHQVAPDVAKVGGDFQLHVKDQVQLDEILARANATLEVPGFALTGAVGGTAKEAAAGHVALKEQLEASGQRAARGQRPLGVTAATAKEVPFPEKPVESVALPAGLPEAFGALSDIEAFNLTYTDRGTGLLSEDGFFSIPKKAHVVALDLTGFGAINKKYGEAYGDQVIRQFGRAMRDAGGAEFDVAHLHGDEYAAQSNDLGALLALLDKVQAATKNVGEGEPVVTFKYGEGPDYERADQDLTANKRKRPGQARGETGGAGPTGDRGRGGLREGRDADTGGVRGPVLSGLSQGLRTLESLREQARAAVRRVEEDAGTAEATGQLLSKLDPKDREALLGAEAARRTAAEKAVLDAIAEGDPPESLRAEVRKQVEAEVDAEPVRKVEAYLTGDKRPEAGILSVATGQLDPSLLDEHGRPFRLDRQSLVEDFGADVVKQLPRGATVEKGGVDADFLAERFGFADGDAMVEALRTRGDRQAVVEQRLQERMAELYPSIAENPAAAVLAAVDAEHSPKAVEAALEAARILVRQVDPSLGLRLTAMADHAATKATAERLVADERIAAVQPERYLAAEREYAREALDFTGKALGKNEAKANEYAAQAMDAREKQLLNMALYRAARDARAEVAKGARYLDRGQRDDFRRELGKATSAETDPDGKVWVTQPYLDRWDDLTGSIGWGKAAGKVRRGERFAAWLEEQPPDARDDILSRVSPATLHSLDRTRHWTDLTVQELRDLVAAAETIEAQAKLKSKLRTKQGDREKEAVVAQVVAEIRRRYPEGGAVARFLRAEPVVERLRQVRQKVHATFTPPEELYRELGPALTDAVWKTLSDQQVEAARLIREVAEPIVRQIDDLPRAVREFGAQRFLVDGQRLTGEQILAAALNWGNLSNRSKLLRGEAQLAGKFKKAQPISAETFQKAMSLLSRDQVDLLNTITRQVGEAKWEDIAALEKEFTGLAPPKIEASPFKVQLADGTEGEVRGGYYPIAYDGRFSTAGQRAGEAVREGVGALAFSANYERAVTSQGHLQRRIESFARPLDLTLGALPRAIVNHMRDLAMRRALVQTREILTDPRIRDAILEAKGEDVYRALLDHWRDTANEYAAPRGQPDWLLGWAGRRRSAATGAVLAGNVGLAIQNFANVGPALDAVPARFMTRAFRRFATERFDLLREIFAESSYMRERFGGRERLLQLPAHEAVQHAVAGVAGRQGAVDRFAEEVREVGNWMMETTDLVTAIPAYLGAREHAMQPKGEGARGMPEAGSRATGLGMTREEAVGHAEQVIRLTQSSYRWMDKSAFERHPVFRHVSQFYRYMNAQLGRFVAAHADASVLWNEGFRREAIRRVAKSYALLMASGVMADLLVGKGPTDDDGDGEIGAADWAKWAGTRAVLSRFTVYPVVGGFLSELATPGGIPRDPSLVLAVRPLVAAGRAIVTTQKALSEEGTTGDAEKAAMEALEAFGWYYGLPVVQFRRTGDYWLDITPDGIEWSEEAQEAGPAAQAFGTLLGPNRPGRLGHVIFGE